MKTNDILGEEIRKIREKLSLTQKELAEELKVSPVYLSYLEQGKKIPSLEFIKVLYEKINIESIPSKVLNYINNSKNERKKKKLEAFSVSNYVYLLEEKGLFDQRKLKNLLKREPQNLRNINAMLVLLLNQKKNSEAEKFLLDSLKIIEKPEEKKWLQSIYHKLNREYELAIQFILISLEEFDKNNSKLNYDYKKKKAHFYFQTACLYFEFGQYLYYQNKNRDEIVEKFNIAIDYHILLRKLDNNPLYQMDYASIFFWFALLRINPIQNWKLYIKEAKHALRLNYFEGINNFPSKSWSSVYSKAFILVSLSFIARSYAEISTYEDNIENKIKYLDEGESIFIQSIPLSIPEYTTEYYRYFFNMACFYSIKAELMNELHYLNICTNTLNEAKKSGSKNILKIMKHDLESVEGLNFYKLKNKSDYDLIINNIKKELKND